jgi:hypothetical protein
MASSYAHDDAEMSFEEIGKALGIPKHQVLWAYQSALRKLQRSGPALIVLIQLQEYHHALRARSAECLAAQEHW